MTMLTRKVGGVLRKLVRWRQRVIREPAQHQPFSIEGVVSSYRDWLEVKASDQLRPFVQRLRDDPEAAHAEAVTFSVLRCARLNPRICEVIGTGGVDFVCEPLDRPAFVVEVTSLSSAALTRETGLHSPPARIGSFSPATHLLLRKAINKASQLAGSPYARLLVVATEHRGADLVFGSFGARSLLTGDTKVRVPLRPDSRDEHAESVADLSNSVFFRFSKDGAVEACRQSISAIVLMTIDAESAHLIGLLHPKAAIPFEHTTLEKVHFAYIRDWPPTSGVLEVEWAGPEPGPCGYPHWPIALEDEELRSD